MRKDVCPDPGGPSVLEGSAGFREILGAHAKQKQALGLITPVPDR
jgi:hypothetical protein